MAIYEYQCSSCGKTFETRQSFKDEPLKYHSEHDSGEEDLGGNIWRSCVGRLEKLPPRSTFALKGSGWSKDGYSRAGK